MQKADRTQGEHCADYGSFSYNLSPFNVSDLRTNLFKEEGNDVPRFVDQSIGAKQLGDQDVLNNLTDVRSSDRTDHTDRAVPRASRLELQLEPRLDDRTDRTTDRLPRQPCVMKKPKTDMHSYPAAIRTVPQASLSLPRASIWFG
ncbi:hypothetical protein YC2023_094094 [Brassica napus]